jgi:hypothetical protein
MANVAFTEQPTPHEVVALLEERRSLLKKIALAPPLPKSYTVS